MHGFVSQKQLRHWIAGTSLFCLGAGTLSLGGCIGSSRETVLDTAPGRASLSSNPAVASAAGSPGRVSLSDAAPRPRASAPTAGAAASAPIMAGRSSIPPAARAGATAQSPQNFGSGPQAATTASRGVVLPPQTDRRRTELSQRAPTGSAGGQTIAQRGTPTVRRSANAVAQVSASRTSDRRPAPPVIRPTPADPLTAKPSAEQAGFERQRADRLMQRARLMLQNNFREEALRLALVAEQLEVSLQAQYQPGEERPSDFIARLRRPAAPDDALATADQREIEALLEETRQAGTRRDARVDLVGVTAGWHTSTSQPLATKPAPATEAVSTANAGPADAATAVAPPAAPAEQQVALASATAPAVQSNPAPAPQIAPPPPSAEPSASAEPAGTTIETVLDDAAIETEDDSSFSLNLTSTSIGGLLAGIAGLLGLSYWRRQEMRHYADAAKK